MAVGFGVYDATDGYPERVVSRGLSDRMRFGREIRLQTSLMAQWYTDSSPSAKASDMPVGPMAFPAVLFLDSL